MRSSLWFAVAVGFCALRAAKDFVVAIAFIQVVARVVQLVGVILRKRRIAQIGYGVSAAIITIMFMFAMADEGAKSTIDSTPTHPAH